MEELQRHPDYKEEKERLSFTKAYMKLGIQNATENEVAFKENIKKAFEDLDYLDSSLSYINILTNAKFLEMTEADVRSLKSVYSKPYFARINFKQKGQATPEVLYIGKTSLFDKNSQQPIIVDWRSPIANVYYDGRLGDVSYEAEGTEYHGHLTLKRQFIIEDGSLVDIRDIDLTTRDELLQQSLSETASNRLTEIVSTIQEEQNRIIRADLKKPIIVQGAAGSGKTTIALHRISYFIYTYADHFSPEQLMILAPNRLFIDYISEVLPELGVEKAKQTTFVDYVLLCLGKNIKLDPPDMKLIQFLQKEHTNPELIQWISNYKGSLAFKKVVERYLDDVIKNFVPSEDLYIDKFRIYSAKKIKQLIVKEYQYLPLYRRKEKIRAILMNQVRTKKKDLSEKVSHFYGDKIERALFKNIEPEKRKRYVTKALEKKEELLANIQKQSRTAVRDYMKQFPQQDVFYYFKELVTKKDLLIKYSANELTEKEADFFANYCIEKLNRKTYELEDLATLLLMKYRLFGLDKEHGAKNVIIDEAQDYSHFQLAALKEVLNTDMFTIVGDVAQGIHSYRGISDWTEVKDKIFPRATYATLQKSYRTTVEIMMLANEIQSLLPISLPTVEPVVRHGDKPKYINLKTSGADKAGQLEEIILTIRKAQLKTIAVICKTLKECQYIEKLLNKNCQMATQVLKENEEINKDKVVFITSHLAKGLEFDAVIIYADHEFYGENELDIKLLYVAMTRPLHLLYLLGRNKDSLPLNLINNEFYSC